MHSGAQTKERELDSARFSLGTGRQTLVCETPMPG